MARGFTFARATTLGIASIRHFPVKAGETFIPGSLVVLDANGELVEAAAAAVSFVGVAGAGAFYGRGYDMANSAQILQVTGRDALCPVYLADPTNIFACRGVNGGTDPVTPAATNVDEKYGIAVTSHVFYMDIANTTQLAVEVVDINIDEKMFFVKFLAAAMQLT